MNKSWQNDYLYWQAEDKRTLKRINQFLQDIDRNGYSGIGKPEPLSVKIGLKFFNAAPIIVINKIA
jgi:Txe/YoeB family toxin of toxin-antitoxin system